MYYRYSDSDCINMNDDLQGIKPDNKVDANGRKMEDYWPAAKRVSMKQQEGSWKQTKSFPKLFVKK